MQNNNSIVHRKEDNKRIWSFFNESPARCLMDIYDLRILKSKLNGRQYIIPDKFFEFQAQIRAVFNGYFRSQETYLRIFHDIPGLPRMSYKSAFRRIKKLKILKNINGELHIPVPGMPNYVGECIKFLHYPIQMGPAKLTEINLFLLSGFCLLSDHCIVEQVFS